MEKWQGSRFNNEPRSIGALPEGDKRLAARMRNSPIQPAANVIN